MLLAQGKTKEADEALRQSLKGFDEHKRGNDRDRYLTLNILIEECVRTKRWEEAIEHCTASRQAGRRWLAHILPAMAPGEQLLYLLQEERLPLCLYLSIAKKCATTPKAAEASAEWLLNSKATAAECLAAQMQFARQSNDPNLKQIMREPGRRSRGTGRPGAPPRIGLDRPIAGQADGAVRKRSATCRENSACKPAPPITAKAGPRSPKSARRCGPVRC